MAHLIGQKNIEGEREGHEEQQEDWEELQEGDENVSEHHHVDTKAGELSDEQHKF